MDGPTPNTRTLARVEEPPLVAWDMHQRPQPLSRSSMSSLDSRLAPSASRLNLAAVVSQRLCSSKESSLPSTSTTHASPDSMDSRGSLTIAAPSGEPMLCGVPLKYVSLVTLAIQNATLSIVMHYSRISTPMKDAYSPATAVLLNELIKGTISFIVALLRTSSECPQSPIPRRSVIGMPPSRLSWWSRFCRLCSEIFSRDCFKLSIPAILYVIQNSLQFVAISNLPVASFQVAYQMKILTTAAFSVALLGRRLTNTKWTALLFLAIGVGIVQIQTSAGNSFRPPKVTELVGSAAAAAPRHMHVMEPLKGFAAVVAACFTSGLAGVYFEMVLKNSKADLWVRNVQLSLFSIIPALLPIIFSPAQPGEPYQGLLRDSFKNFGGWAWATVAIQVFGGLVTAIVIKYSDNIMKGFATSLSIILSFLASVVLFDFHITYGFLLGSSTVLAATWMYNQPARESQGLSLTPREKDRSHVVTSPVNRADPILGEKPSLRKLDSLSSSTQSLASLFSISAVSSERDRHAREEDIGTLSFSSRTNSQSQFSMTPYTSRSPSPFQSEPPTPGFLHPSHAQRPL